MWNKELTPAVIRQRAEAEREAQAQRDARWLERRQRRHRISAIAGAVVAGVIYLISAMIGHVSACSLLLLLAGGMAGAFLISRWELGILGAALVYGAGLCVATGVAMLLGWWLAGMLQMFILALSLGLAVMLAGLMALHIEGDEG
jgi:hypothetical protein